MNQEKNMPNLWFSSDSHYSHNNILKFCKRPYANVDEMNVDMVKKWNQVVKPDDSIYHLGDFSFKDGDKLFYQLNGHKHLIIGNHDGDKVRDLPWESQEIYSELEMPDKTGKKHRIILFHYPISEWDGFFKGAIHLHGHVHGKKMLPELKKRIDVAVDCFNFFPVSFEKILELTT